MVSQIVDALRREGYRLTGPRKAVIDVLSEAESWLSPEVIQARAVDRCPGIGLVTVYRTLGLLSGLGYVHRVHEDEGCHGYALAGAGHGHHIVCRSCRRVVDLPECHLEPLVQRMEAETGFSIENHMLELVGLCPACQAAQGGQA